MRPTRNRRSALRIATLGALFCFIASAFVVAPAASASPGHRPAFVDAKILAKATNGPIIAKGKVNGADGKTARSGFVAALAWPSEAAYRQAATSGQQSFHLPTVGWARIAKDGTFKLRVDPKLVGKKNLGPDGQLDLNIVAWSSENQGSWNTTAWLPDASGKATGHATPNVRIKLSQKVMTSQSTPSTVDGTVTASYGCGDIVKTGNPYDAWVVIGETWPYGPHTGNVIIDVSHSLSLGTAQSLGGSLGSWSQTGSSTKQTNTGDDFNGNSGSFRDYRLQMRYQKYFFACTLPVLYVDLPEFETGGFMNVGLDSRDFPLSWQTCAPASGNWWRSNTTGSSYTQGAGIKLLDMIGINMTITTGYATTRKLTYYYNGSYKVCGSNDVPSKASKVRSGN